MFLKHRCRDSKGKVGTIIRYYEYSNCCDVEKGVMKALSYICVPLPIAYNVLVWFCKMNTDIGIR